MPKRLPPKPPKTLCLLPTHCPAEEAEIYQRLRQRHCDDKRPGHDCQGRLIIDRNGITLSCPRCGDARSVFPPVTHLPGYWMDETSGVLRPAIEAYLHHREMTPAQIAAMQAYLRQWISAPCWSCDDDVADLRTRIDALTTMKAIASWLDDALDLGIDPL